MERCTGAWDKAHEVRATKSRQGPLASTLVALLVNPGDQAATFSVAPDGWRLVADSDEAAGRLDLSGVVPHGTRQRFGEVAPKGVQVYVRD